MSGPAVSNNLVGMSPADADAFYQQCISASETIINQSGKVLHVGRQTKREDAVANYQGIFMHP